MKTFTAIAASVLAVSVLAGPAAQAQPAQAPAGLALAAHAGTEYLRPVGLMNWADKLIAQAGIVRPAGMKVVLSDVGNCGATDSPVALGGCTTYTAQGPVVNVSPALGGWQGDNGWREHIVFHELGHALGLRNECLAEFYAHEFDGASDLWSYEGCNPAES